jgi:hypothetical protein
MVFVATVQIRTPGLFEGGVGWAAAGSFQFLLGAFAELPTRLLRKTALMDWRLCWSREQNYRWHGSQRRNS